MKALLVCPSTRPAVAQLGQNAPLAAVPLLGQSLVEYWLTHLALSGVKEVRILADDRPEQIQAIVEGGARWGIKAEVTAESRELTPAQAQIKYAPEFPTTATDHVIAALDHFPGMPEMPLFTSYSDLFAAIMEWMPRAQTIDRVGVREIQPCVWVGLNAHIAPDAQLNAPCWIGQSVYIGSGAVVGPMAIVEDRTFVEAGAEIVSSVIGPDTFVGQLAVLRDSFALGSTLASWKTGSCTQISDAFILSALRRPTASRQPSSFVSRLLELLFEAEKRPAVLEPLFDEPGKRGRAT